jgi:hypothetical protein
MRDVNDDLEKSHSTTRLKRLAEQFANLIQLMFETVIFV